MCEILLNPWRAHIVFKIMMVECEIWILTLMDGKTINSGNK